MNQPQTLNNNNTTKGCATMKKFEIVYVTKSGEVRSKIYDSLRMFTNDCQIIKNAGRPMMVIKPVDNEYKKVFMNGLEEKDLVLTAEVQFDNSKVYTYSAAVHYSGYYIVKTRSLRRRATNEVVVAVKYRWRKLSDIVEEMNELGYKTLTPFESIKVKKVK